MTPLRLPFELDRNSAESLISQLVRGVSQGIGTGFWKPGDILPSLDEFAAAAGVSLAVVRGAMRRLADQGVVNPRPGVGTVVLEPSSRLWRGHVIVIDFETRSNFLFSRMSGTLRANLIRANYLPSAVSVAAEEYDPAPLEAVLRQPVSLAVVLGSGHGHAASTLDLLAHAGVPAIVFTPSLESFNADVACLLQIDHAEAWEAFADHCKSAGVRRMAEVWLLDPPSSGLKDAMARRGIVCELWEAIPDDGMDPIENVQNGTTAFFEERLSRPDPGLPDLLYFADDYAATAALVSLLRRGVRIPEDVQVVSHVNRGSAPPFPGCLARIEVDSFLSGGRLTDAVLSFLNGRKLPPQILIPAFFHSGASLGSSFKAEKS